MLATAAMQTAHAILAARGEWVTNEKRLLERAGLRDMDAVITRLSPDPAVLAEQIDTARQILEAVDG